MHWAHPKHKRTLIAERQAEAQMLLAEAACELRERRQQQLQLTQAEVDSANPAAQSEEHASELWRSSL